MALIYMRSGDEDAATEGQRRAVELSPTFGLAHLMLGYAQGNHAEALMHTQIAEQLLRDDANPAFLGELALSYSRHGHREDAERIFHRLEETAKTHHIPSAAWVTGYLALGDDEQALHWLNTAADSPEPYVGYFSMTHLKANVYSHPVLEEPRFRAVRERLGSGTSSLLQKLTRCQPMRALVAELFNRPPLIGLDVFLGQGVTPAVVGTLVDEHLGAAVEDHPL